MTLAVWALCPCVMLHRSGGCDLLLLQVSSGVICSWCTAEYRPLAALWSCFKQTAQSQPSPSEVLKLLTCHIKGALGKSGNTHTPLHSYIYLMFISLNLMMGKVCETWVIKVQKRKKARDYGLAPLSPLLFKEVSARTRPLFLTSVRRGYSPSPVPSSAVYSKTMSCYHLSLLTEINLCKLKHICCSENKNPFAHVLWTRPLSAQHSNIVLM